MTLSVNGVDYVATKRILSGSVGWKNNLLLNAGFFPGSGLQNGLQVRGRMEVGARVPSFQFTARLLAGSPEYNTLVNQTTGTATLSVQHDANNSVTFTFPQMAFQVAENAKRWHCGGDGDRRAAVQQLAEYGDVRDHALRHRGNRAIGRIPRGEPRCTETIPNANASRGHHDPGGQTRRKPRSLRSADQPGDAGPPRPAEVDPAHDRPAEVADGIRAESEGRPRPVQPDPAGQGRRGVRRIRGGKRRLEADVLRGDRLPAGRRRVPDHAEDAVRNDGPHGENPDAAGHHRLPAHGGVLDRSPPRPGRVAIPD